MLLFLICIIILLTIYRKLCKNKKILISIEGNIGVGKTSMINLLKEKFGDKAEYIYEPVDEWHNVIDENGKDLLQTFYENKMRWAYTFQNIAYITRMQHIVDKLMNSTKKYIIIDRSLSADLNTFSRMLYDDGYINELEWNAYNKWNNFFVKNYVHLFDHKMIYLRCEPCTAYMRMKIRNREAEKDLRYEYMELVHRYHDDWLLDNKDVLVIDVNRDFVKNKDKFENIYKDVDGFISDF